MTKGLFHHAIEEKAYLIVRPELLNYYLSKYFPVMEIYSNLRFKYEYCNNWGYKRYWQRDCYCSGTGPGKQDHCNRKESVVPAETVTRI